MYPCRNICSSAETADGICGFLLQIIALVNDLVLTTRVRSPIDLLGLLYQIQISYSLKQEMCIKMYFCNGLLRLYSCII